MTRYLSILFLSALVCMAEESPFKGITFQKLQFNVPGGKVIVLDKDYRMTWPKGVPSAATQSLCDAIVMEKGCDVSKVTVGINQTEAKAGDLNNADAIAEWNVMVSKLQTDGKLDGNSDTEQARAVLRVLKKLFPHVFK